MTDNTEASDDEHLGQPTLIHCGLHRTGTTTLHYRVFPQLPGIDYAHKPPDARVATRHPRDRPLVISHEGLLVRGWTGRSQLDRVKRLAEQFPRAQPLLTLRGRN